MVQLYSIVTSVNGFIVLFYRARWKTQADMLYRVRRGSAFEGAISMEVQVVPAAKNQCGLGRGTKQKFIRACNC